MHLSISGTPSGAYGILHSHRQLCVGILMPQCSFTGVGGCRRLLRYQSHDDRMPTMRHAAAGDRLRRTIGGTTTLCAIARTAIACWIQP